MKLKKFIIVWFIVLGILSIPLQYVDAKGGGGFSSSSGGRSFSSSSFSGKSSGGSSWGSKSTPSSPSTPSSWGNNKSTTAPSTPSSWGNKSTTNSAPQQSTRASALSSEVKGRTQAEYVKKTTPVDWNTSRATFSTGKTTYTPTYTTVSRPRDREVVVVRTYNNNFGGYYYNDPFNHSMIWMFSDLWWWHHWNEIDRERYADDARYHELETRMKAMEAKGMQRDPNYRDPNMDDGVMYGDGYLNKVKKEDGHGFWWWFFMIILVCGVIVGSYWIIRKLKKIDIKRSYK